MKYINLACRCPRETDESVWQKQINLNNCHSSRVISSHMVEIKKYQMNLPRVSPQEYHVQSLFLQVSVQVAAGENSLHEECLIFFSLIFRVFFPSLATNSLLVTVDALKCTSLDPFSFSNSISTSSITSGN